ncbi:MAG: tetratricopeptide repeat protein [Vulcanimicrobiota bacterium]
MKKSYTLILCLVFISLVFSGCSKKKDPFELVDEADKLMKQEEVRKAVPLYKEALEIDPDLKDARIKYIEALIIKGDLAPADEEVFKILKINPQHKEGLKLKAKILLLTLEIDKSLELYNRLLEQYPDDPIIYHERGNAYAGKMEYEQAEQDIKKAIELKPDYLEALLNLGVLYYKQDEYEKAIDAYSKVINQKELKEDTVLTKPYLFAYYNRANAYLKLNETDKAVKDLETTAKYAPEESSVGQMSKKLIKDLKGDS